MKIQGLEKIDPHESVTFMSSPDGMKAVFAEPTDGGPIFEDVISIISVIYKDKDCIPLVFGIILQNGHMILAEEIGNFVCYATKRDVERHLRLIEAKTKLRWTELKGGKV